MAMVTFVKELSDAVERGRAASGPKALVSEKGQLSFSTVASTILTGCKLAQVGWDGETRTLTVKGFVELPKGHKASDFHEIRFPVATDKNPKPAQTAFIKVSNGLFGKWKNNAGPGYDFKKAGNQGFEAVVDEKNKALKFVIPSVTPTAKPKQIRKPKDGTKAETGLHTATPETNQVNGEQKAA